jgi:hypothetical protein
MWMPQLNNKEILGRILRSTIGVISRRTSEAYANVVVGNALEELTDKYYFFKLIEVQGTQYTEVFDVVKIMDDINDVDVKEIGNATTDFVKTISRSMGKNAGFYFIREIKEDLPFDILKHVFTVLFEILDRESGRDFSYTTLNELVKRFTTKYELLRFVKINDIRSIQGVDIVTINEEVNEEDPSDVGVTVQKFIQEVNASLNERGGFNFVEKIRNALNSDYLMKLEEMGVNLKVIHLGHEVVVKHVLKTLIDLLSEHTTQSYAILLIDNVLRKIDDKFEFFKFVKIDSMRYSQGVDAVSVPEDIESIRPSFLGRGIQKALEKLTLSLGEDAGPDFIDKFKKRLGKAYLLRIEEMGVNLHMINLKQNLTW